MRRGVNTIEDLRERSVVDPVTHCWHWTLAKVKGHPRIWTADLDAMDKRVLSGPRAVWYIAHGTPLGDQVAYMGCWVKDCVCPAHVRRDQRARVNTLAAQAGCMAGHCAVRAISAAKARAAAGHVDTPADVVLAFRQALGTAPVYQLAQQFGLKRSTGYRIANLTNYKQLLPQQEGAPCVL
jgi:hypothetical protein